MGHNSVGALGVYSMKQREVKKCYLILQLDNKYFKRLADFFSENFLFQYKDTIVTFCALRDLLSPNIPKGRQLRMSWDNRCFQNPGIAKKGGREGGGSHFHIC